MLRIWEDERIKELGYKLVLQIHDELILEGPEENGEEALKIVGELMEKPFADRYDFAVPLDVDGKYGKTWYECK